ncbi:Alpha/Beta hydrolase protein [Nemania sp. FL0031]|nr:Alpha/Beta hydrolase protein [Nemania sp. FL0031]
MANPGILYVTMQPEPGLPLEQFHEWYNNEHGPTRLKLPQIFTNGLRYRAADGQEPTFLAAYDVTSMPLLETETYTSLRANRSPREADTIGQVDVQRYFWDRVLGKQSPLFMPIEQLTDDEAEGLTLVAVQLTPKESENSVEEIQKWYGEEHMDMLSKVPGWLRSRLFKTSCLDKGEPTRFIALHDYAKTNGLGGVEYQAAISTPRTKELYAKYATMSSRRIFSLFYTFGAGSRDLHNLSLLPAATSTFKSPDGKTFTTNTSSPSIESFITTPDGLSIPYRLEGNPDPKAPTVAFCNSLLTSYHMWDRFISIFAAQRPQYRILRYDFRGRYSIPSPPQVSTLDILADDINSLLTALRIPKLDTLIGVSMGGATTLKFALKYPSKLGKFVACDFNVASSAANTAAWKDRITIAETPLDDGAAGIGKLAGQTVERWFHPSTMQKPDTVAWIQDMVASNDIEGFRYGCQALWDYDMKSQMEECAVPGLLVVGEGDGKGALVKAMDGFKGLVGEKGVDLAIVPETGHLPMCEDPEGFWKAIQGFV